MVSTLVNLVNPRPDEGKWRLSKWALRRDGSEMVDPCILAQLQLQLQLPQHLGRSTTQGCQA